MKQKKKQPNISHSGNPSFQNERLMAGGGDNRVPSSREPIQQVRADVRLSACPKFHLTIAHKLSTTTSWVETKDEKNKKKKKERNLKPTISNASLMNPL